MIVVDASIIVKWLKSDEADSDKAREIYDNHKKGTHEIIVPELVFIEVANYLVTKSRSTSKQIRKLLDFLSSSNINIHRFEQKDLFEAASLSKECKTTVYDMLYAVIAKRHKIVLVTADERFVRVTRFPFVKLLSEFDTA